MNTPIPEERIDRVGAIPFVLVHVAALGAFVVGFSWQGLLLCVAMYYLRMFGIAGGFHRYFAHRSYRTSRAFQFVLAFLGATAAQKGALWWAGHHRNHHRYSDTELDIHSPAQRGFWWSHVGWVLCRKYHEIPSEVIKDFAKYPEIRWIDRHFLVPPTMLAIGLWMAFSWTGLFWGFFLSTVLLWHGTFTVNSIMHVWGKRRYETTDTSRNNFPLAFVTLGENWHNNHHYYQASANQGFYWWEIDVAYYVIRGLEAFGIVWDVRTPPKRVLEAGRTRDSAAAIEREAQATVEAIAASELRGSRKLA